MKTIIGLALTAITFTACADAGDDKIEEMPTMVQETPSSSPNPENNGPYDTSTTGVSDSSTVISYDTAARKRQ